MNRKMVVGLGLGVLMGLVLVGGMYTWGLMNGRRSSSVVVGDTEVVYNQSKITYLDKALELYYIDERDEDALIEGIYRGYVYGLDDSYTRYLTVDEFNKQKEESVGNYVGTGIKFAWGITSQHLIVTEVIDGSPAQKAGIEVGDKIVAIDGTPAMGSNELEIYEKLARIF